MNGTPSKTNSTTRESAVHQILQQTFKAAVVDDPDNPGEEKVDEQMLDYAKRDAAAQLGIMLLEAGVVEVNEVGDYPSGDEFRAMEKEYEMRCPIMKDPYEIEKKFQEARNTIQDQQKKIEELRRKLRSIKQKVDAI